ncbi:MAG TPA: TOBE domain-containing protein [Dissulfurispiraceae bacterium]|nr:TOBE domain-containing protein [Dissulfurispiraceae bacterium]
MMHRNIVSLPEDRQYLDSGQLNQLEQSFREWIAATSRPDVRLSRLRILLIFLLIRYTGAKLNEVLSISPLKNINFKKQSVLFRNDDDRSEQNLREVLISEALAGEVQSLLADPTFRKSIENTFGVDPGFVRRKFYERAEACGFSKEMGGPEMIRKSRAVELMQNNMPLPAVQKLLGHSTPNLTSSYVSFSEDDIRQVTKYFMERESSRKTSARNTFFGKIVTLRRGDIQTLVELSTIEGHRVTAVITNDSAGSLALKEGMMVTAEVKAPYVIVQKTSEEPKSSAENRFKGIIEQVNTGKISAEYVIGISDGTSICSIITTENGRQLNLGKGDEVWAVFNCFAVVLRVD